MSPASKSPPPNASLPSSGSLVVKTLLVRPYRCVGCRTCEVACAFAHPLAGRPGRSRIRIHPAGAERFVQVTCLQCVNAACAAACPVRAIERNPRSGALEVNLRRCVGCGLCAQACPFGHMHFEPDWHRPEKCDLCGGQPACAAFCPHGALQWR